MAALSPPRLFAAWRSRLLFPRFPFLVDLAIFSLARCLTLQDSAPRFREDSQHEYGRPHDTLSCLFFTALLLGQGQSILPQLQKPNETDLTFYKILPTKSVTCLQVGPMSLEWAVAPSGGSDQSSLSPSQEDALLAPPRLRWRRDALQPPEIQRGCLDRKTGVHIPEGGHRCATWNTRGLVGSPFSSQTSRERKHNYFSRLTGSNDIICLQEIHGKDEFLHAFPALWYLPRS